MFPVYPQDFSEIKFVILSQPAIILDSSTWLEKTEIQGRCWMLLIPLLAAS